MKLTIDRQRVLAVVFGAYTVLLLAAAVYLLRTADTSWLLLIMPGVPLYGLWGALFIAAFRDDI